MNFLNILILFNFIYLLKFYFYCFHFFWLHPKIILFVVLLLHRTGSLIIRQVSDCIAKQSTCAYQKAQEAQSGYGDPSWGSASAKEPKKWSYGIQYTVLSFNSTRQLYRIIWMRTVGVLVRLNQRFGWIIDQYLEHDSSHTVDKSVCCRVLIVFFQN